MEIQRCLQFPEETKEVTYPVSNDIQKCCLLGIILLIWMGINLNGNIKVKSCTIKNNKYLKIEIVEWIFGTKARQENHWCVWNQHGESDIWCNSLKTVWWIGGISQKLKPFVTYCVGVIQPLTQPALSRYVPNTENSANLVSRILSIDQNNITVVIWTRILGSITGKLTSIKIWNANQRNDGNKEKCQSTVPTQRGKWHFQSERYLTWTKLTRGTAWVKRFLDNSLFEGASHIEKLSADEISDAETYLIRSLQQNHFAEECKCLSQKKRNLVKRWDSLFAMRNWRKWIIVFKWMIGKDRIPWLQSEVLYYLAKKKLDHKIYGMTLPWIRVSY